MLLPILTFPDKRLRIKAKPITKVDNKIKTLVANMFETMYKKNGIGLAATQIDYHYQIIVMDVPKLDEEYQAILANRINNKTTHNKNKNKDNQICLINPKLIKHSGMAEYTEGCLSVEEFQAKVKRYKNILISALDINGKSFEIDTDGLLSVCIQHEMDHLQGKLFIDHLSKLKQQRLKTRFTKLSNT